MNFDNLRNWLSSVVGDVRSRRLLPVLALLVAAAIVVPIVLAKSGTPAKLAAVPGAPIVTATAPTLGSPTPTVTEPAQNYLTGPDQDPFNDPTATRTTSAVSARPGASASSSPAKTAASAKSSSSGSSSSAAGTKTVTVTKTSPLPTCPSGETPGVIAGKDYCLTVCRGGKTPVLVNGKYQCTTPGATTSPAPSYTDYVADITFGPAGGTGDVYHHLARYELLPNDSHPVGEFLGVEASNARTAVFWVPASAKISGGAECSPSASECEFVAVQPGGAFYIDLSSGANYQVYRIQYDSVTKVTGNGTYALDTTGQQLVDRWKSVLQTLDSLSYAPDSGLMTIDLGTSQPTTATADLARSSTGETPPNSVG